MSERQANGGKRRLKACVCARASVSVNRQTAKWNKRMDDKRVGGFNADYLAATRMLNW